MALESCMSFRCPIEVRFSDLDALGHVNHATLISLVEHARTKWWKGFLGASPFQDEGFLVARLEVDYRKPVALEDPLEVELRCTQIGTTSFTLAFRVYRMPGNTVMAEGQTVQVMLDFRTQRPRPLRPELLAWLQRQGA